MFTDSDNDILLSFKVNFILCPSGDFNVAHGKEVISSGINERISGFLVSESTLINRGSMLLSDQ